MPAPLIAYLITASLFGVFDFIWLSTVGGWLYIPLLSHLMRDSIDIVPAALFYLSYTGMITALVVWPAYADRNSSRALINGLMLGFAAYATYNLTNAATLEAWPWRLSIVDMAWGTVATGLTAWLAMRALGALRR